MAFIQHLSWSLLGRHNGRGSLKSPASRLFTQPFIQTQIKEYIKAPRHWPLCGEFTGDGEFPAQMVSNAENVPFDDVIMIVHVYSRSDCFMLTHLTKCHIYASVNPIITDSDDGLSPIRHQAII